MARQRVWGLMTLLTACAGIAAQEPQAPRFEVASVRPSLVPVVPPRQAGGRLSLTLPLRSLIARAYGVEIVQVVGAFPLLSDSFEVSATAENADATPAEMNQMLKSLLLDRFQVRAHTEIREADIWILKLAKSDGTLGPRLKRSSSSCVTSEEEYRLRNPQGRLEDVSDRCDRPPVLYPVSNMGQPISVLVSSLKMMCCPLVEDRTGLTERYDWDLVEGQALGCLSRQEEIANLFIALEAQLGLKVEAAKGKVQFLVIDSVSRPTEN